MRVPPFGGGSSQGEPLSHRAWLTRDDERRRLRDAWHAWFADFDVLLWPVSARSSFPIDEQGNIVSGTLGLPSVVAPVGLTADGRPVGVQIVAPYLHDHVALEFARRTASAGHLGLPPHW